MWDDQFEAMMDALRRGENEFVFTDEDGVFEERFELRRVGERKVKNVVTGEVYESVSEAAKEVGTNRSYVSRSLNHPRKGGTVKVRWEYEVHSRNEWMRHVWWKKKKKGMVE